MHILMQPHKIFSEKKFKSIVSNITRQKFKISIVQDRNPSYKFLLEQNSAFSVELFITYDLIRC